ncbi:MAG: galactose mutarotase [Pedobacter sp.]|nr:galactose mutarotase [Pedobacter sp.]
MVVYYYKSAILILIFIGTSLISNANGITKHLFGEIFGQKVYQYTLVNKKGMVVKVITYGASITDVITADRNGKMGNVVFGFDSLSSYTGPQNALMGAIVGRVANRIAGGMFTLNGQQYRLSANIHGGKMGFDKKVWTPEESPSGKQTALKLSYFSKDGEEGYPGNLKVSVTYLLTDDNELVIKYAATTDKPTHVNLTNHSYFNLSGGIDPTVLNTNLTIAADQYLEAGGGNIPTGRLINLKGSPLDFSVAHEIGERIMENHLSLTQGKGYDLTYALRSQSGKLKLAARAYEPISGRVLQAYTTEPGLVFYTANHFNSTLIGRGNKPSVKYGGFCLETQHYPDAPNQPKFSTTVLNPGQTYKSETIFKFSVL